MRGRDLTTCLPDELIVEIFGHLDSNSNRDSCSLVCKRWLRLERLSRTSIRIGTTGCSEFFINLLASCFCNVRNVHIDERLSISVPVQLERRHASNSSVVSPLKLRNATAKSGSEDSYRLSDAGMAALGEGFPKLEKLSLIWCSNVSCGGLTSLARKCVSLKALNLQGHWVEDQGLAAVGQCCKQLEDLNLRSCEGLTDTGFVELALGIGKSLKSLRIAACAKITDISMEAIGSHCQSLESLSLDSEYIHSKGLIAVAEGCPNLKALELHCLNVSDDALKAVAISCLSLELLALYSFQKFTNEGMCAIGKGCKKLKDLILTDFHFLSYVCLVAVATGCKNLTHLRISGCHKIGTMGLESIGKFCRNLKKLYIQRCYEIGSPRIVATGEHWKSLTDLTVRFCDRVDDKALIAIARGGSLLRLSICGCHRIVDAGLIAIARECPKLCYLNISALQNVSNLAMAELGEHCPLLKEMELSNCHRITDNGLALLVKNCPKLEYCDIFNCLGIASAGVATLVSCYPRIKVSVEG